MSGAFQANAFQNNAFQVSGTAHDGVGFDADKYRKLQEKLKRQRLKAERRETERSLKLRQNLTRLYQGLPLEERALLEAKAPEELPKPKEYNYDNVAAILARLTGELRTFEQYQIALRAEIARRKYEQEQEEELEMVLMTVL